jgi:hypothetical protein
MIYAQGMGMPVAVGTAADIADQMEHYMDDGGLTDSCWPRPTRLDASKSLPITSSPNCKDAAGFARHDDEDDHLVAEGTRRCRYHIVGHRCHVRPSVLSVQVARLYYLRHDRRPWRFAEGLCCTERLAHRLTGDLAGGIDAQNQSTSRYE